MSYELLKVHIDERVGWIEYDRPPINSFNHAMLVEVRAALDRVVEILSGTALVR